MLLALDAGNTNITIGAFDGAKLTGHWRLRTIREQTPDEWGILLRNLFSLSSLDLAAIDGVVISNISIEDARAPIFIRLGNRARSMATATPGSLKNISIQNVTAMGADLPSSITGVAGGHVQDVMIDGLTVTVKGGGATGTLDVPEVLAKYPESTMFGELPSIGVFARHVDGLTLRNIKVHAMQPDARPTFIADDVTRLELSGFDSANTPEGPILLFRNVVSALLYGNQLSAPANLFLSVMGASSKGIALRANSLGLARKVVAQSQDVPAVAVSLEANAGSPGR